jgi:hypothetical protein
MVVKTIRTPTGHSLGYDNAGTLRSVTTNRGTVANLGAQGRVRSIQTTSGTLISYQPGGKRVESERVSPNGARYRVVSTTPRRGYVERDFSRNGATYVRRTYVSESRTHVSVYRTYYYGGSPYRYYVPAYYYAPTYYRWVYNPWPAPVYYAWGWNTAPWYAP